MSSLANRQIIVGITGGIAAYKACEVVRRLRDLGASVRVIMTPAAAEFITPLTLQALSGHPVHRDLLDEDAEAAMGHIELARWADLLVITPASADFMARMAAGMADDLLSTTCLATEAPIMLAPAMNQAMWRDPATAANAERLAERGVTLLGPAEGQQACGDTGPGRMLEPSEIAERVRHYLCRGSLAGRHIVITAGPTREAIDPVRYISNHSSGKMGYAIAEAAAQEGARVTLISGPVALAVPRGVECVRVDSALAMYSAVMERVGGADVFIGSAAVADYRPEMVTGQKIKKNEERMTLTLVRNPDIVATVAGLSPRPLVVGFAAETEDVVTYARQKMEKKGLDLIVANDVSRSDIGFNSDMNEVTLISAEQIEALPLGSKAAVARTLISRVAIALGATS